MRAYGCRMKLVGIVMAAALLLAGCGGESGGDGKTAAKTFTASGAIKLYATGTVAVGDSCAGKGGYDDIRVGAAVLIKNADGKRVALGELGTGEPGEYSTCSLPFAIKGVPSGAGPYSVEVSHRGEVPFNEGDAKSIALTLG